MFREFDRLFEDMFEETRSRVAQTTKYDPREYDGVRIEHRDGETTVYYKQDGEWVEESNIDSSIDIPIDMDDGTMTLDVSGHIDADSVSASMNNGIVELSFTAGQDD